MVLDGILSAHTGICGAAIITTIICMDVTAGHGVAIIALVCTCIACAPCTETTRATGVVCVPTGTCGVGIITTDDLAGSGVAIDEWAVICIDCEYCDAGMVLGGTMCAATGTFGDAITTTIISMAGRNGAGDGSGASVCTCTDSECCTGITKGTGAASALTGTCGDETTTTRGRSGLGAATDALGGTSTDSASSSDGMEVGGMSCASTGISTEGTTTITVCTAGIAGPGADIAGLACISTGCARCTAITRAIGAGCARIGTCGAVDITTRPLAGSGVGGDELVDICIACAFCGDGMALGGTTCAATGTCGEGITTTTTCTADTSGYGVVIGELVFICIGCEPCTATTRDTGVESGRTGTCGVATTTTSALAGSGATATDASGGTSTDSASSSVGMEVDGTTCAATGTCTEGITTTIACTDATNGGGADTGGLACISIGYAHCTAITRAIGVGCARTGTCIGTTTTTSVLGGSGQTSIARLDATGTAFECTSAGLARTGEECGPTGTCTDATTTITTCMAGIGGLGVASGALECICTDCAHSTGITRDTGAVFVHIGTFGGAITTTNAHAGSGQGTTVDPGVIFTDCACIVGGTALAGTMSAALGGCIDATITTTTSMVAPNGVGGSTGALAFISIVCGHCTGITKDIGGAFVHIGTCGVATTTTNDLVGSGGTATERSVGTGTGCACCGAGMVHAGTMCVVTGTCGVATITITICTVGTDGLGADSGASVSTSIGCEHFTGTTKVTGVVCEPTGTCGAGTTTTSRTDGSGAGTAVLDVTCIACASSAGGTVIAGTTFVRTGICGARTTTITTCMDATNGAGADSAASVCTCTDCEPCTETTKATGAVCVRTGICGDATTTTSDLAGSGPTPTKRSADTGTATGCTGAGMVDAGIKYAATGTSGGGTTTIITSMVDTGGSGDATDALVCICTGCERCTAITKATGAVFGPTGTSGVEIITTGDLAGSGPITIVGSVATNIAYVC